MQHDELPQVSAESIRDRLREIDLPDHAHSGPHETVREADYRGHHIVVRTTYTIEVDGRPVEGHLGVTDDGTVHYHPVPNLAFPSAIDMVKQLIDVFPDDFGAGGTDEEPHHPPGGHEHGGSEHRGGDHGGTEQHPNDEHAEHGH